MGSNPTPSASQGKKPNISVFGGFNLPKATNQKNSALPYFDMVIATMSMAKAPNTERKVRRSVFGIGLHGWEQLMLLALAATGLIAIAVAFTTTSVVTANMRHGDCNLCEEKAARRQAHVAPTHRSDFDQKGVCSCNVS